jgi:pimeloyl-ACP methyl ester carboxylesterase
LIAALCGLLLAMAGVARAGSGYCSPSERQCMRVTVPIDRSGAVPGTIALKVERHRATNPARPPLFMLAGGPGQSATRAFDPETVEMLVGTEMRSRDVVVMDVRGTGDSGVLSCPALQRSGTTPNVAACAQALGPRRAFYSSADIADDIEAVRQAIGAPKIALYGVSYGTHVALAYASRYPGQVDRLVLDAIVGPGGIDAFERPSMNAVPRVARDFCGKRRCSAFARDAGGEMARLAARLDARAMSGFVTDRNGRRRRARIDGAGLLNLVMAGDFDPFVRAEAPAAVSNALEGDPAPLLRAQARARRSAGGPSPVRALSDAAYVATLCEDTQLPWGDTTPISGRRAVAQAFVTSLPPSAFAPFGRRTALESFVLDACEQWPSSQRSGEPARALPDVPALLLAGTADLRTPLENARAVAGLFPQGRLLVVGNAGHDTLGWDLSGCPTRAFRRFLAGGEPGRCPAMSRFVGPLPTVPQSLAGLSQAGGVRGRAGKTLRAVQLTVADGVVSIAAELIAGFFSGSLFEQLDRERIKVGALRGGSYSLSYRTEAFGYQRASLVPGVRVSGRLRSGRRTFRGVFKISGPSAVKGRLVLRRGVLKGRLGGREVRARFAMDDDALAATASSSSQPARLARRLSHHRPLP